MRMSADSSSLMRPSSSGACGDAGLERIARVEHRARPERRADYRGNPSGVRGVSEGSAGRSRRSAEMLDGDRHALAAKAPRLVAARHIDIDAAALHGRAAVLHEIGAVDMAAANVDAR